MKQNIVIIDYGAGNIKSIQFALERLGHDCLLTSNVDLIRAADKVIFPGVGEASSAMEKLRQSNLDRLIPTLKQPVLGVCLGMQLMCRSSEEGSTEGLNIFDIDVIRFPNDQKVPHMGWNTISQLE
ncbi:MAG: imidazole glycerol phosphate synthase subunit HisH, partial [Flavobacteriaceae bacterium]|nr:imidazole glycerol phosphate synthase subunit HisH [Flavobacteriaceae bacterium]